MNTTTRKNYSSIEDEEFSKEKSGNSFLLVTTITNFVVTTICLLYIILKLKLNKYIKSILCIMAIQNIIGSIVSTVANTFMILSDSKSLLVCLFLFQSCSLVARSITIIPSLVSFMRYTMASKASKVLDKLFYLRVLFVCLND